MWNTPNHISSRFYDYYKLQNWQRLLLLWWCMPSTLLWILGSQEESRILWLFRGLYKSFALQKYNITQIRVHKSITVHSTTSGLWMTMLTWNQGWSLWKQSHPPPRKKGPPRRPLSNFWCGEKAGEKTMTEIIHLYVPYKINPNGALFAKTTALTALPL